MAKKNYATGMFFNEPRVNAPDYVIGSISIKPVAFIAWLNEQQPTDKGYVRLDVNMGRDNKPYVCLNEYKNEYKKQETEEIDESNIPF